MRVSRGQNRVIQLKMQRDILRSAIPLVRSMKSDANLDHETKHSCRIALSLGPYGAAMSPISAEYTGIYPLEMDREDALRNWHAERLKTFVEREKDYEPSSWDQVDYVAFETLRRPDEVRAVRGAMRDMIHDPTSKPWWVCGVFPNERVDEGEVRQWVQAAIGNSQDLPRPWGIGLNCTRVDLVSEIVSIMRDEVQRLQNQNECTVKPWLVLYPDGTKGEKYDPVTKTWVHTVTDTVKRPWDEIFWDVVQNQSEGGWEGIIIGGCCRAGPADIAALRRRIDGVQRH